MKQKKKQKKEDKAVYTEELLRQKDLFSKQLKKCRNEKHLSHSDLAEDLYEYNKKNSFFSDKSLKTYEITEKYHQNYESATGMSFSRFLMLANYFNVSLDYMAGRVPCKTPENQEIYNLTGLNDTAINKLKNYKNFIDNKKDYLGENYFNCLKRLQVINYLIETLEDVNENSGMDLTKTSNDDNLIDNIHSYIFSDFNTNAKPDGFMYDEIIQFEDKIQKSGHPLQKKDVRMAKLLRIQSNLMDMQKSEEIKRAIEKTEKEQ